MYAVEFIADKIPWFDSVWDGVHTAIRPLGGALIAIGTLGDASPGMKTLVGLLGGTLAAGTHFTKAGTRAAANTSPEPFSNWILSLSEDVFVVSLGFVALKYPLVAALVVIVARGDDARLRDVDCSRRAPQVARRGGMIPLEPRDGNRGADGQAGAQAQVDGGRTEDQPEQGAKDDRLRRELGGRLGGWNVGLKGGACGGWGSLVLGAWPYAGDSSRWSAGPLAVSGVVRGSVVRKLQAVRPIWVEVVAISWLLRLPPGWVERLRAGLDRGPRTADHGPATR